MKWTIIFIVSILLNISLCSLIVKSQHKAITPAALQSIATSLDKATKEVTQIGKDRHYEIQDLLNKQPNIKKILNTSYDKNITYLDNVLEMVDTLEKGIVERTYSPIEPTFLEKRRQFLAVQHYLSNENATKSLGMRLQTAKDSAQSILWRGMLQVAQTYGTDLAMQCYQKEQKYFKWFIDSTDMASWWPEHFKNKSIEACKLELARLRADIALTKWQFSNTYNNMVLPPKYDDVMNIAIAAKKRKLRLGERLDVEIYVGKKLVLNDNVAMFVNGKALERYDAYSFLYTMTPQRAGLHTFKLLLEILNPLTGKKDKGMTTYEIDVEE
jgi:hypothetical protein